MSKLFNIPKDTKISLVRDDVKVSGEGYSQTDGLIIYTNNGDIKIGISMESDCCEQFDGLFLETPDNLDKYIGATIISVEQIDIEDSKLSVSKDNYEYGYDSGGETQLKITTSKGVLQYGVYNSHNGYYSHATFIGVFGEEESSCL